MAERLIDAEAFFEVEFKRCGDFPLVGTCSKDNEYLGNRLSVAPTIEAKPIVHAHWKDIGLETKHRFCTKCGCCVSQRESWVYKYCPCCGAQMDEVASDNNVGSKTEGVKIPVISMEDVPKIMEEKE